MENNKRNDVVNHKFKKTKTILINNQYSTDSKIISNQINEYFIKVGSSLENNFKAHVESFIYVQPNEKKL